MREKGPLCYFINKRILFCFFYERKTPELSLKVGYCFINGRYPLDMLLCLILGGASLLQKQPESASPGKDITLKSPVQM